jgi:uncharacterized SAM-binding protein YcdF (DUF218 family)
VSLSRRSKFLLAIVAIAACAFLLKDRLLEQCYTMLVQSDPPVKAGIAVVLSGDGYGQRIMTGGDMVRAGYVPVALVTGPTGYYEIPECDTAIDFAVRHGYPASYFEHFHDPSLKTTEDEARAVMAELNKRHVRSILLVTSTYHTARAGRLFRRNPYGITVRVIAAPDHEADNWRSSREGRKRLFFEWTKTVAGMLGI